MRRRPPRYTRADTLLPYTPLFRATRPVLRSATPPIDPGAPLEQPDDPAPGKRLPRKHPLAHCRLRSATRRADAVPATRDAAVCRAVTGGTRRLRLHQQLLPRPACGRRAEPRRLHLRPPAGAERRGSVRRPHDRGIARLTRSEEP